MPQRQIPEVAQSIQAALADGEQPISKAGDLILQHAAAVHASDVHIEPGVDGGRVRFRIDGFFADVADLTKNALDQLVARLKVMAGLVVHKRTLAQDGRIVIRHDERDIACRLAVVPTVNGERAVLRLFDQRRDLLRIDELGISADVLREYEDAVFGLEGVIVLTGPSGSGKTTTLYATLEEIRRRRGDSLSIVAIEDPVEYNLGLFAQMEVDPRSGFDFSRALGAALRQDPEVIMVGEIRDVETCRIAMRAGLTGHLVLTTVHTGAAPGVLTRLLDMEVEPSVVASSLRAVLAQRLVRLLCPKCAVEAPITGAERALLDGIDVELGDRVLRPQGCAECMQTGYKGRTAICEFIRMDEEFGALIQSRAPTSAVERLAREKGLLSLAADGVRKVREGLTTVEEVVRVTLTGGGL